VVQVFTLNGIKRPDVLGLDRANAFKNYRNFMANKGLPGLISTHGLSVDKEKIVSGGNIALFLLRAEQE
jgi:hypothetical protein